MRLFLSCVIALSSQFVMADSIKFRFENEDLVKMVDAYAKASGQKFVVDPSVRGKASILLPGPVSVEEAFSHLSSALAVNGYAMSRQGDTLVIKSARNIQRDLIEVGTELPALKPERMYTLIVSLKNIGADRINRDFRILTSKDGELTVNMSGNQLIITDWVSSLYRVAEIIKVVDRPTDPSIRAVVDSSRPSKMEQKKRARGETPQDQVSKPAGNE